MTEIDMTKEAQKVRDAMALINWRYIGGGPYPNAPVLQFERGAELMRISLEGLRK
jgi:hypothetical protein